MNKNIKYSVLSIESAKTLSKLFALCSLTSIISRESGINPCIFALAFGNLAINMQNNNDIIDYIENNNDDKVLKLRG